MRHKIRVIPVMDVKQGHVVRAVAGKRETYLPVQSTLAHGSSPETIATALVDRFGAREVYVADLDAIAGAAPSWHHYACLTRLGLHLWVDAGVNSLARAHDLIRYGVDGSAIDHVIVGLESIPNPGSLGAIVTELDTHRLAFSLDLIDGRPWNASTEWSTMPAEEIASVVVAAGITRMIVLDLSRVGQGDGTGTVALCRTLRQTHPNVELIAGGGIRDLDDIRRLADIGCDAALVASALHNGRITPGQLREAGR